MDNQKIGAFIAARRKEMGLTQQQLAERLGVTNKAVSKWESGNGIPDISLFTALAEVLGVTADELLRGGTVWFSGAGGGRAVRRGRAGGYGGNPCL